MVTIAAHHHLLPVSATTAIIIIVVIISSIQIQTISVQGHLVVLPSQVTCLVTF